VGNSRRNGRCGNPRRHHRLHRHRVSTDPPGKADARVRQENALAELLAAAQDLVIGTQAIRQAHERRTKPRYYLRLAAMFMRDYPVPGTWRDLADLSRLRPLMATALEADRYQLDESRTIALDLATVVAAKVSQPAIWPWQRCLPSARTGRYLTQSGS
jgi:hypothetical protein